MIVNVASFLGFNSARRVGYARHVGHSPTYNLVSARPAYKTNIFGVGTRLVGQLLL